MIAPFFWAISPDLRRNNRFSTFKTTLNYPLRLGVPMDLLTKDLLINFLFIFFHLFGTDAVHDWNIPFGLKGSNGRAIALFPVIAIISLYAVPSS